MEVDLASAKWWSSAPTPLKGQVPFPVGKKLSLKISMNYSSQTLDLCSLAEAHHFYDFIRFITHFWSKTASSVPSAGIRFLPRKQGSHKNHEDPKGRRYQSSFSNNWCNACEKARANVFSFWEESHWLDLTWSISWRISTQQKTHEESGSVPHSMTHGFSCCFAVGFFLNWSCKQFLTEIVLTSRSPCLDASTNCHH